MRYQMPVNYYSGNLAFGDQNVWAYYEIPGFYYDFLSEEKKIQKMLSQSVAFTGIKVEFHMLVVPVEQDIEKISREYEKQITGPLREIGIAHNRQVTAVLKERCSTSRDFKFYLGVKLMSCESERLKERLQEIAREFKKRLYQAGDMYMVTEAEIKQYERSERQVYQRLSRNMEAVRVTEKETQFLIERNFTRGIKKISPDHKKIHFQIREGKRYVEKTEVKRLSEGLLEDDPMDYIRLKNNGKTIYMTFLCVSDLAYESEAVGNEFIYYVQEFDFPVDLSIRARVSDNESSRATVRGKKEGLEAEIRFAEESGESAPQEIIEGEEGLHELEYDLKKSKKPLFNVSIVLCIYGDTEEEMRSRAAVVKEEYKSMFEIVLEQPHGDQLFLFNEFLPGAELKITDYVHVAEPNFLASGMFGATKKLGDPYGFYLGTTGINNQPVFVNLGLAARGIRGTVTNSLSMSVSGATGGGKSMGTNDICYNAALGGARVLTLDPKGERTNWIEDLPELGDELNIVTLYADEEYRGLLDPWYVMEGKEAEALAISVLTILLGIHNRDSRFKIIAKAVKEVGAQKAACLTAVRDYLLNSEDGTYVEVGEDIDAFYEISFAVLLFGDGRPVKTINLESAINILQIQNLSLPSKELQAKDYTIANVLSIALLTPITAFADKFIHSDRSILKLFVSEEAWATLASSQGMQISDKLTREGRALNGGICYVSQNVGVLSQTIKDNIGIKFAYRCKNEEEVAEVLNFFDLEKTDEIVEVLKNLPNGHCLMQDIWGRIGILAVDVVFQELYDAWDTSPPAPKVEVS